MSTSRTKALPKRGYHHGDLRRALVDTALELLEKREEGDLSLREISRKAGVSANAAYRHFADKESLMQALAAEGFRRLAAEQAKAASAQTVALERHRASGKVYVKFARANPALFRLMFGRTAPAPSGELKMAGELAFEALRASAANSMGLKLNDERVTVAAIQSWSLVHGLSQLILAGHLDELGPDLDSIIDAVLRPPARRS